MSRSDRTTFMPMVETLTWESGDSLLVNRSDLENLAAFPGGQLGQTLGILGAQGSHLHAQVNDSAFTLGKSRQGVERKRDTQEGDQPKKCPRSSIKGDEHGWIIGGYSGPLNPGNVLKNPVAATCGRFRGYTWPVNSWRAILGGLIALVIVLSLSTQARAQGAGVGGDGGVGGIGMPDDDEPKASSDAQGAVAAQASVGTGEVRLKVVSFGVGGKARAGDWIGIQVDVTDNSTKVRDVLVRLNQPDADGDVAWVQRAITTNPAQRQSMWLYTRLPSDFNQSVVYFSAFEAIAEDSGEEKSRTYRAGKLLGSAAYVINTDLNFARSFVGVVGSSGAGVEQYMWPAFRNPQFPPTGHEHTEIAGGLQISNLPDRWMGLEGYSAIIWTGNDPLLHQPSQMRAGQPEAIREWVMRGGHLVIVLPPVGQTWYGASAGEGSSLLTDVLPRVTVKRREGVSLEEYRSLLTRDRRVALPESTVVQTFEPESAGAYEAMPLMLGANGEMVVVRRLVGSGAVTVIGLDLASPRLREPPQQLEADQFWHRILGQRLALPTPAELDLAMKGGQSGQQMREWVIDRREIVLDAGIARMIAKSGSAAAGVLLGLLIFSMYWIVAAPFGYFGLRAKGHVQHSWLFFVGAIGLFTAIAWGGANLLKTRRVEGQHLTILDGVYGQTYQRARSFVSVFLPKYGEQRVSIASSDELIHNAMAPWEPPSVVGGGGFSAFPDARGYAFNSRLPNAAEFPARATVKQIQVDWLGALPASWGMPVPSAASNVPIGSELRIVPSDEPEGAFSDRAAGQQRKWAVLGTISHNLPGTLQDVYVVLVRGSSSPGTFPGSVLADAHIAAIREWPAATPVKVDDFFPKRGLNIAGAERDLAALLGEPGSFGGIVADDVTADHNKRLVAISLFQMLKPPGPVEMKTQYRAIRQNTHAYDLSRWFTQPCLIVIGVLENSALPVPLRVDTLTADQTGAHMRGKTLVRWVFPLATPPAGALATADPNRSRLEANEPEDSENSRTRSENSSEPPGTGKLPGEEPE